MSEILTFEQQAPKNVSTDNLNAIENDPNLLERIITCDKLCFCANQFTGKAYLHREPKNSKEQIKVISNIFFFSDIHEIVPFLCVPEGQIINLYYYIHVYAEFRERMRKKRPANCGRTIHSA
ncbi:putative mariner transposase [Nephila pilipes]|uniref:Putative mariner transposase n=1 Tax=Nephila pilipes TaxID=299642 RepID=A0A8X6UUQ4_NEPPI|nr:putative mariner transposase [Nephila pilipes]